MTRFTPLIAACLIGTTATAQDLKGTQEHDVQKRFVTEPCTAVISKIDTPGPGLVGAGEMAMTFGFLMGYETLNPGIRGDHETILMRLREDCSSNPKKTAMELLEGYSDG